MKKKPNMQDATLLNIRALKKRVKALEGKVNQLIIAVWAPKSKKRRKAA